MDHALQTSQTPGDADASAPGMPLTWRAHPFRARVGAGVAGLVIVAMIAFAAASFMGATLWGVFAAIVLMLALQRFYFPSFYSLDDQGITASFLIGRRRRSWSELRRFDYDDEAGFLSRRAGLSRLDRFGGMPVLLGDEPDAVIEAIRTRIGGGV